MTIDQANGNIYIVFYDRRNYDDRNTDVYLAVSTDGGETFENVKISDSPFYPSSSVFFGDYTNITAYNGQVRPVWCRLDDGQMSLWTALIDATVGVETTTETVPFSIAQNYPNPFRETTWFPFKVEKSSVISLMVFDIYGRKVATLIDRQPTPPGKYVETFVARDYGTPAGIYWFVLANGHKIQKRKMIIVE